MVLEGGRGYGGSSCGGVGGGGPLEALEKVVVGGSGGR